MGRPTLQVCGRGHDISVVGRYSTIKHKYGTCKACQKIHGIKYTEKLQALRPKFEPTPGCLMTKPRENEFSNSSNCKCFLCLKARAVRQKRFRKEHPEVVKKNNLKHCFGLSVEDWNKMLEAQKGKCAVCGQEERHRNQHGKISLSVDHDHVTGKIRALLCHYCNTALGLLNDNVDRILALAEYRKRYV